MIFIILIPLVLFFVIYLFVKVKPTVQTKRKIGMVFLAIGFCLFLYSFIGNFYESNTIDNYDINKTDGFVLGRDRIPEGTSENTKLKIRVRSWGGLCIVIGGIFLFANPIAKKSAKSQLGVDKISNIKDDQTIQSQIIYRETKDNKILTIVYKNNQPIGADVFIGIDVAADGEYEYLNEERTLTIKNGKIVSISM